MPGLSFQPLISSVLVAVKQERDMLLFMKLPDPTPSYSSKLVLISIAAEIDARTIPILSTDTQAA
jgi:hypothetical protein